MKVQIKDCFTEAVIFECEVPEGIQSGMALRHALEKAVEQKANLRGANLRGADLGGADLGGANLSGANLRGADLSGKKLVGQRPFLQIGPIGSRCDYFTASLTDAGVHLVAGCFSGDIEKFEAALEEEHGDNQHAKEYRAALVLVKAHAEIWTPAVEVTVAKEEVEAAQ